jgi:hypothetical protein
VARASAVTMTAVMAMAKAVWWWLLIRPFDIRCDGCVDGNGGGKCGVGDFAVQWWW